ncbi:MAG: flagellin-like protein [Ruminococcus sp.]|nr:flagellin-like protein [Ruminococcus sp.]
MSKLNELSIKAYVKMINAMVNEQGEVNIVATVLLIGIAVILAIFFKDQISDLLKSLFNQIKNNANGVMTPV